MMNVFGPAGTSSRQSRRNALPTVIWAESWRGSIGFE
ncbi:hypothetical protein DHOM_11260 [Dermabacter hominis 1368]|uniref:Uncharacterized protein n=1 Tax=Dermabacter hominis 1368 TaxID=1450519 RepID=A0ABR4SGT7_9MICO|nr:hypothetical protein DHOM_11260 [Dermabacter hominis 1368]